MINEVQRQLDEIKDLIISGDVTKKVIISKLRNLKKDIANYFSKQKFTVKDMKTRQELLQLISSLTKAINEAEKTILKMQIFNPDDVLDVIMALEENILETLIQIHVIGEARPLILDLQKEIEKKLKKETIKIPENIEKYGHETIQLYRVLKLAPPKEYSINELVTLTKLSREEVEKAIENLKKEGYIEVLYKGDEKLIKWSE